MFRAPHRVLVLDVVGLTPRLLAHAPRLAALARGQGFVAPVTPQIPAVTCTAQATMLTGSPPRDHGIVGNGWYFRDLAQVWLWRQSNALVRGEKVWETARARAPGFSCAKLFWWYNMHSSADVSVTPRPAYLADGRKLPDVYSRPGNLGWELQREQGSFPLFQFWGPGAGIASSAWIARAAIRVWRSFSPDLELVYLPHLDYDLQRLGPDHPRIPGEVAAVDRLAGEVADAALSDGARVVAVSEYGIERATTVVMPNRALREAGLLQVEDKLGQGELLDCGASRAFAVCDHQMAHVYVADPNDVSAARERLASLAGVERVLDRDAQREIGLDHERSGELVLLAEPGAWFAYTYWLEDARAPDFARTVDIHQKPGYDPCELFLDPARPAVRLRVLIKLARKLLGFRYIMDVIPLDPSIVRGTHGRPPASSEDGPLVLSTSSAGARDQFRQADIKTLLLETIFNR